MGMLGRPEPVSAMAVERAMAYSASIRTYYIAPLAPVPPHRAADGLALLDRCADPPAHESGPLRAVRV